MKLLSIALLAATLGAQESEKDPLRVYLEKAIAASSPNGWYGHRQPLELRPNLPVHASYDHNGALEAFYVPTKHHWYASKKFWVPVAAIVAEALIGIAINSTRAAGSMYQSGPLTQYSAPQAQQPGIVDVTHIGIGGPGIPVTIVHGSN